MKIRQATVSDVPALVDLNRIVHAMHATAVPGTFRKDPPEQMISDAFKLAIEAPSAFWLVAEEEQQAVGFLSADFRQRDTTWYMISCLVCYIGGIVVEPRYRRKGIARALLAELKREAGCRCVDRIELDVWEFNREAKQVFTKLGFHSMMERMTFSEKTPNKSLVPTTATITATAGQEPRQP